MKFKCSLALLALLTVLLGTCLTAAAQSGAIFTTTSDGTVVNGNIYNDKADVYLNGGPQNEHPKGIAPDGVYYFQVTDPSGAVKLSTDDISCRQVTVSGGVIAGATGSCPHPQGTFNAGNGSTPVQLAPFTDTPNNGTEYKVWLTLVASYDPTDKNCTFGFCNNDSKTDNFKVVKAGTATVSVCKFNDQDYSGTQDTGEPFLAHWPITATGVDGGTVNAQTDDNGCVSFSFTGFSDSVTSRTVTLTEGTQGTDWTQTSPADGACAGIGDCNVSGGIVTLTLHANDNVKAPNFGNFSPSHCGDGCPLVVTKTAYPALTRKFAWTIAKTVDQTHINTSGSATFNYTVTVTHDAGTDSDWKATGTITVSNPTAVDWPNITVTDTVDNGGACSVDGGVGITVPANSHVDLTYTCTYDGSPNAGTNSATATWDSSSATGTATVDFTSPAVHVIDGSVDVTDTLGGPLGTLTSDDSSTTVYNYSQTFTDPAGTCTNHANTATFTANPGSTTNSDSKTVQVCVGADPSVSKTAVAAFTSAITKDVNKTRIEQANGSGTFNYTVAVTESGWNVAGNITVTNTTDWEPITINVADALSDLGGACTINGGNATVTVAASSFEVLPYSCTFASAPSASGTNTATGTWDAAAAFTTNSSASGSASYGFQALTVTDNFNGTTTTLGTIGSPTASTTYTYSHTVTNAVGGQCKAYSNTATIVETNQSADKTVNMCNTATAALTMGFWQNKNGQGIITGGASTAGVCNSGAFLRTFAPFQDLSATATCAQVGTYVTNVIKSANASGAAMNAMLKGQMLSTALDVFFSDPSTGNPIHAPTPIGTVKIDLTQVCTMLDGSGGVASCSGSFINVSSAFGGATCMTVGNMLLYQNGVSNVGGSFWYGQIKATQQLAKNAFDAINNQAAYIAP